MSSNLRKVRRVLLHDQWEWRQSGEERWRAATVPGCNFLDLQEHHQIEDPFYRDKEKDSQWVESKTWEYRSQFDMPESDLGQRANLVFSGLDTYATVVLNGTTLLEADNMFRIYRVDCRQHLVVGTNELRITFRSPIAENLPKFERNKFTYPAENDRSLEKLSVYSRKAPYHFGWDWGPRLVCSGIWREVALEVYDTVRIDDVNVITNSIDSSEADLTFTVAFAGQGQFEGLLELKCLTPDSGFKDVRSEIRTAADESIELRVKLPRPKLWWPNGLGEAFLYAFEVSVSDEFGVIDRQRMNVGVRTVEVVNDKDAEGMSFYLKVNGYSVFMKGANYIPSDSFPSRVNADKYRRLFTDVVSANFNMLRVWGGGIYEDDLFYELADEHGILIWQDFMFACTLYPADSEFLDSVRAEVTDNITRLRNHPCIALWCGNNEVAMGIECWEWPEKFDYSPSLYDRLKGDYQTLFHELLPGLVRTLDPSRFYLPSSPIGFWEDEEQDGFGNSHFWGVWHGGQGFDEYARRISRFATEYGFQSFPLLDSVQRFTEPEDRNITTEVMLVHQKHPRGNQLISDYLEREFKVPVDFEHFLYLSQVLQADGLRVAFEAHRKARPFCMGTLYWQLNDCWPVASWSGIDYYGKWKALHYQAKRSFLPIIVVGVVEDGVFSVHVVSDLIEDKEVTLKIELIGFCGQAFIKRELGLTARGGESQCALSCSSDEILSGEDSRSVLVNLSLHEADHPVAETNVYFAPVKLLELKDPCFTWRIEHDSDETVLIVGCEQLAKSVYVHIDGLKPEQNLPDNFFDLVPGREKRIVLPDGVTINTHEVHITSVYETTKQ